MSADLPHAGSAAKPVSSRMFAAVVGLFFFSGSAGLVYQVLWMRSLGLFFGSDMYGVSIILSTFMGGLALGSLLGGRLAERVARPLVWYGLAEIVIGLYAPLFPRLLGGFEPVLAARFVEGTGGSGAAFQMLRLVFASGMLLLPTAMMGATLPLVMRHFVRSGSELGGKAATFYAVNTLGALTGTLAAGFVLLPYFGMTISTWCAASINLAIGALSVAVGLAAPRPPAWPVEAASPALETLPELAHAERRRVGRAAIVALGVSGFGSFALEVVWTRILIVSFSATVYAFASMLACFLLGIFVGSILIARVVDEYPDPLRLFAGLELGVAVSVGGLCALVNAVPGIFSALLTAVAASLPGDRGGALVLATLLASFLLLIVPTTLLGATFSVALRAYTANVSRVGSRTGNLYASNTLGSILGSLVAGLVLVPALGARASLALVVLLFAATGLYLVAVRSGLARALRRPAVAGAVGLAAAGAAVALLLPYRVTLNFNQKAGAHTQLLYHAEGIQNSIDLVRSRSGITSLVIGGNVEADDAYTQRRHFVLKGHLPLLLAEDPRRVLVIGLGMGITLASTARHEGVERIDVIELSPEILEAQSLLREINDDVARNPIVHVRIDDGRSYMKLTRRRYDMITADPIHPKISRVGYLYTREYYRSIRERLAEGGVVCQWMPIYQIAPRRLRSAVATFLDVFPDATLWYVENHALLVAKAAPFTIDRERLARRMARPGVAGDLASIDVKTPEDLLELLWMGPDALRAYVAAGPDVPLNTDDYPYLEYFVPGDLFYPSEINVAELARYRTDPGSLVAPLPRSAPPREAD